MVGLELEANALCDIYKPANLQSIRSDDALKTFEAVNGQIRQTIQSKEFKEIFKNLAEQAPINYYDELAKAISTKLGKPWVCEDAKAFYTVQWQKVETNTDQVVIQIRVLDGDTYQINDQNYSMSETDEIRQAINLIAKDQEFTIQLYIPKATEEDKLNHYLDPLRKIGVKQLSIVEDVP